ncbi:hypothetical protein ABT272_19860 [Streptomyces sp900105245]|uniref:Uncharacterized protein n=1 Tax=Streptomyces sp. 900105245 TaxID=3154379 RepID=A0ABV1U8C4_9ACTN
MVAEPPETGAGHGSQKGRPLSGLRSPEDDSGGRWEPLFTTR